MERAFSLAVEGVGLASPNPTVGCVLVKSGRVVGEGFHDYERRDHAEVVALKQAGEAAAGATAYVTLEPCSHIGRTGPCADALMRAGIGRVVVATLDPNPLVSGGGVARMGAAGVPVEVGLMQEPARRINDAFARYIQTQVPLLTLKSALTLDGRIAPRTRESRAPFWLTGPEAREEVQRMRHASDAILVGVNTVVADDPLLNDRSGLPRRRRVLRVVLDSTLRLPLDSQLVKTAEEDVLVFCAESAPQEHEGALLDRGVRVQRLLGTQPPLTEVMTRLGSEQITSVLVEGGAQVHAAALNDGLVDKVALFYAPFFMGEQGVPMLGELSAERRMRRTSLRKIGEDFLLEGYLRDPWSGVDAST